MKKTYKKQGAAGRYAQGRQGTGTQVKEEKKWISAAAGIPGAVLLVLLPCTAHLQEAGTDLGEYEWFPDFLSDYDVFMLWKSRVFLVLVLGMLLVLVLQRAAKGKKPACWKRFLPLFLYGGLAVVSTIVSIDKTLSLEGMLEQYETIWVLLGYVATAFYFFQTASEERCRRGFLWAFWAGALLQGLLGLSQLVGADFWQSGIGRRLLTIGYGSELAESIQASADQAGKVYMGSYNSNYAAVYIILAVPVLLFFGMSLQKKWEKGAVYAAAALLAADLIGSGSKTGVVTAVFLIVLALGIFAAVRGPKSRIIFAVGICAACAGVWAADAATGHNISSFLSLEFKKTRYLLESVEPKEDYVEVQYNGHLLKFNIYEKDGELAFEAKEEDDPLPVIWSEEDQCFRIDDDNFEGLGFGTTRWGEKPVMLMYFHHITWYFEKEETGYVYVNYFGKKAEIIEAPAIWKGYERMFTNRVYIWGRTVPLLKDHLLTGTGPDTFALAFPQEDYRMRANTSVKTSQEYTSKAHNLYLQSALQTGVLSLVCLLVFWLKYLLESGKNLLQGRKQIKDKGAAGKYRIQAGLLLGILGYLLMGMMNDSVVAVAPVFWAFLGMGTALLPQKGKMIGKWKNENC